MPPITLRKVVLITVVILLGAFAANSIQVGTMPVRERSVAWVPASDRAGPARHLRGSRAPARPAIYRSTEHNPIAGSVAIGGLYGHWDEALDF